MQIVLKEIDRLNNLISEFLDYVKPDIPPDQTVNISLLLTEVMDMVKVNHQLRSEVKQDLNMSSQSLVLGDKNKLKQAFLNIVINAYQAMEKADDPVIQVSVFDNKEFLVVEIRDNGSGIDEKNMKHIFEPFHTTKPKGTGLGLAMTHKIFESHGAKVYVESEKGKGTIFTIEFEASNDLKDEVALKKQA